MEFSFCLLGLAPEVGLGVLGGGVQFLAWGFAMAPHGLRVLVIVLHFIWIFTVCQRMHLGFSSIYVKGFKNITKISIM